MICRATRLPPNPGAIWLSRELEWSQNGRHVSTAGRTVVAPSEGLIWLGDLTLLNGAGDAGVDPYAQYTLFGVLEFGASYGSGGIGWSERMQRLPTTSEVPWLVSQPDLALKAPNQARNWARCSGASCSTAASMS